MSDEMNDESESREMRLLDKLVAQAQSNILAMDRRQAVKENPVKNLFTVKPFQLEPGDVLLCVVKLVVTFEKTPAGRPVYRLYRCAYPADTDTMYEEDVPQGSRVYLEDPSAFGAELFPVVSGAGMAGMVGS